MSLGKQRVIKVLGWTLLHPQAFHNAPRTDVGRNSVGDDFVEPEPAEAEIERGPRGFRGIAVPPVVERQPPPDLNAGSEARLDSRNANPGEPDAVDAPSDTDHP